MIHDNFQFNLNSTKLFGQFWQPEEVKAVILLIHGMGEHSSRYEDFVVPKFLDHKYAVISYDNFGHGRSEGKRGHCPNYSALLEGIDMVIGKSKDLFPNKSIVLYGHSMGGNLAINFALRRHSEIKGVVATSPFLRLAFQPPKWKLMLGKVMLRILPSITLPSELEVAAISRDPNEVKRYTEDSMVHDKVSPMFTFPIIEAGKFAIQHANSLSKPMLIVHGTGDRIIDYRASQEFADGTKLTTLKLFEGGYHELHHDLCKEDFMRTILDWLNGSL